MLQMCWYRVWNALRDLEAAGRVYHRKYPVTYPSGAAFIVRVFFLAGMADGGALCHVPGVQDIIDLQAARGIDQGKFVQKRNIAALKEMRIS